MRFIKNLLRKSKLNKRSRYLTKLQKNYKPKITKFNPNNLKRAHNLGFKARLHGYKPYKEKKSKVTFINNSNNSKPLVDEIYFNKYPQELINNNYYQLQNQYNAFLDDFREKIFRYKNDELQNKYKEYKQLSTDINNPQLKSINNMKKEKVLDILDSRLSRLSNTINNNKELNVPKSALDDFLNKEKYQSYINRNYLKRKTKILNKKLKKLCASKKKCDSVLCKKSKFFLKTRCVPKINL